MHEAAWMLLVHLGQDRTPVTANKSPWGTSRQTGETLFYSGPVRPPAPLAACDRTLARNGAEIVAVIPGCLGGFPHALFGNRFARQRSAVFSFHCYPAGWSVKGRNGISTDRFQTAAA